MIIFAATGSVESVADFDPITDTANCTMDVSGHDSLLSGLSDGDGIGDTTKWTDRVTGTRTWALVAGHPTSNRPLYRPNSGPNGKPYLEFTASDRLEYSVQASNLFTASAFAMCAVVRPQSNGHSSGTESGKNIFSNGGYIGLCLFDASGTNKFRFYRYNGGYTGVNGTTTYSQNVWYIVQCWYDGTNLNISVNGDTVVSVAASNPQSLGDYPQMSWVAAMVADITRMTTWNTAQTNDERADTLNGYADFYGITL